MSSSNTTYTICLGYGGFMPKLELALCWYIHIRTIFVKNT